MTSTATETAVLICNWNWKSLDSNNRQLIDTEEREDSEVNRRRG